MYDIFILILWFEFFQEENYITCLLEDGNGGSFELPAMESEENHLRKIPENNGLRNINGDSVKVKEEVIDRKSEEEDEEYIEVDEVSVKTEPQINSQDCTDSKNGKYIVITEV